MSRVDFFEADQRMLIEKISQPHTSLSRAQATVSVYLYLYPLAKPIEELEPIIAAVDPTWLSKKTVGECLQWMKDQGLIKEARDDKVEMTYLKIADNFGELMEKLTLCIGLKDELEKALDNQKPKVCVKSKGIVRAGKDNYTEMLEIIRYARESVDYAVLTTEPYPATVRALETAAKNGVSIRILVASKKLTQETKAQGSVFELWKEKFGNFRNDQIKESYDNTMAHLCSSIKVDGILRFDIYDHHRTRSLDGYLIELRNDWNEDINLIHWYDEKFNKIWDNAYSSKQEQLVKRVVSPFTGAVAAVLVCVFLYFKCRADSEVSQNFVDEILLLIVGAGGEYILRAIWPKLKSVTSAVWNALTRDT